MSAVQVPPSFHMECTDHFTLRNFGPVTFAHRVMGHHLPTLTFPETPPISSTLRSWHRTRPLTQIRSPTHTRHRKEWSPVLVRFLREWLHHTPGIVPSAPSRRTACYTHSSHCTLSCFKYSNFFSFFPHCATCGNLLAWPEIEPRPSAVRVWRPNHWTTREFPQSSNFQPFKCILFLPLDLTPSAALLGFPGGTVGKESPCQYRRCKGHRFDPPIRKILGVGNGNLLQYSCLENSMERGPGRLRSSGSQRPHTHTHSPSGYILGISIFKIRVHTSYSSLNTLYRPPDQ